MATVKAKIKAPDGNGVGRVFYQIIHKRVVRRILTDVRCQESDVQWNETIAGDLKLLLSIIDTLNRSGEGYDCADVVKGFAARKSKNTFEDYFRRVIADLDKKGRTGGMKTYRSTLVSFQKFSSGVEHLPAEITPELMTRYQAWLVKNRLMGNTTSFYMRHVRAVYRMMVKDGLVRDISPFAGIFTGIARTRKRAISESELMQIKSVDLSGSEALSFTRDLFMLSFYCMGMSFVDIAFLRKSEIKVGRIVYNRKKTGQTISLRMHHKIKAILDRHPSETGSSYQLPIITRPGDNERTQYENALRYANHNLKKIAELAGVKSNISTYTPRHTWASIAKLRQVKISTISDALGHESESTTQIYLATLDHSHVDKANELIIKGF